MDSSYLHRKSVTGAVPLRKMHQTNELILAEARRLGMEAEKVPFTGVYRLKYEGVEKFFNSQIPSETSSCAFYICNRKRVTRNILDQAGISVVKGYLLTENDEVHAIERVFESLHKPLVVKPNSNARGENVYLNVATLEECTKLVDKLVDEGNDVLVEEMFTGEEYRILVTRDKVLSVIYRIPANVVGDGVSTIEELVMRKNNDPKRELSNTLQPILLDAESEEYLEGQGFELGSVVDKGQQVFLRDHSPLDISLGGDTIDVTNEIHPSVRDVALQIIKAIPGLSLAGIDFMCTDIYSELSKESYRVIEVNASPALDWQQFPYVGEERNLAFEFLKVMYPQLNEV